MKVNWVQQLLVISILSVQLFVQRIQIRQVILAEFWMIEPEMAFYDLEDNMNLAEEFIKYIIQYAMDNNREDLEFLAQRLAEEEKQLPQQERSEMGLMEKLDLF